MRQRALRAFVTQCGQLPFGRGGGQARTELVPHFEQWLIEELGVQAGHPHVLPLQILTENPERVVLAVGPDVRRPRQPAPRLVVAVLGQQVGALEPLQLQPVLQQPQKLI
ncbi:Uncharacterised protein [Mycobacteroides abscessus subsp. abscessus]|nr:Uncharacterised protein [Mycobacteroides abscessus subsp. abscessus]